MDWELGIEEMRILGSLMEKQTTTPDQYPLSINALIQACNQKSNREPVLALSEPDVRVAVNTLMRRRLVRHASGYGGRVSRYEQRLAGTRDCALPLGAEATALLCLLLLRGPQTPGELRARGQRLAEFPDMASVENALQELASQADGALVVALPREAGKRESRYAHTLGESNRTCDAPATAGEHPPTPPVSPSTAAPTPSLEDRVTALEAAVADLRSRLDLD